ncbi:MAG: SRPBCC domain-containing protein [Thermomicrobiales bacterium]
MKAFEASATIAAAPDAIWAILTDAPGYPTWDSGVDSVAGRIAPGEKITVHSQVAPGRAFPVRVTEFSPGKRMVWSGGMPLGLFQGVRTFTLTALAGGDTQFTMREEYSGPLAALITRSIPDLNPSFVRFATGLKRHAEDGK